MNWLKHGCCGWAVHTTKAPLHACEQRQVLWVCDGSYMHPYTPLITVCSRHSPPTTTNKAHILL